jgi:hypothetical protein
MLKACIYEVNKMNYFLKIFFQSIYLVFKLLYFFSKIFFYRVFSKSPPLPQKYIDFLLLPPIFLSATKNAQKNEKKRGFAHYLHGQRASALVIFPEIFIWHTNLNKNLFWLHCNEIVQ